MCLNNVKSPKKYVENYFRQDWVNAGFFMKIVKYVKAIVLYYFCEFEYVLQASNNRGSIVDIKSLEREDYNRSWRVIRRISSFSVSTVCRFKLRFARSLKFNYTELRASSILRVKMPILLKDIYIFHCPTEPLEYILCYTAISQGKLTIGWQHAEYQRLNSFFNLVVEDIITHGYLYHSDRVKNMLDTFNIKRLHYFKVTWPADDIFYDENSRGLVLGGHPIKWKENVLMYMLSKYFGLGFRFHPKSIWSSLNSNNVHANGVYSRSTKFVLNLMNKGFPGASFSSVKEAFKFFNDHEIRLQNKAISVNDTQGMMQDNKITEWIESL